MAEISVIIPTLKDPGAVDCVPYLERDGFTDYEIIVRRDEGASTARNEGIKRAAADKLVFLDDDSRPREGYLDEAARVLEEEAVVAGRIVHPCDDTIGRHFTDHYSHGPVPAYVDTFVSCNMALRREVFDSVGLFDENFVWGHEEKELAERVRRSYDIYYDPELVVEHSYADSLLDLWTKRYRQETQRPYYWHLRGASSPVQLAWTAYAAARPSRYVGETVPHTVAKSGCTVAATLGRLRGLFDQVANGPDQLPPLDREEPVYEESDVVQDL